MEKDAVLVCTILGFLGSVAVTLGFVAYSYSTKSVAYDGTNCVYGSPPAIGCGVLGVLLVLINQVIVAAYTSGWVVTIMAVVLFILRAVTENSSREEPPVSKTPTSYACREPEKVGNFPTASLSSLIAVVLGIASYTLLETAAPETPSHGLFALEIAGASARQQSQPQTGPTTGADPEAEHISLATAV
ncbi:unnamed protein product [Alopecurus aequalis]